MTPQGRKKLWRCRAGWYPAAEWHSAFPKLPTDGRNPRNHAIADFRKSFRSHPAAISLLLIDSEGPDTGRLFEAVCQPQQIPERARDKIFWMVECMESSFLADIEALSRYYRRDLTEALRGDPNVEEIPKKDVLARLKAATDGRYHKTKDAPHILKGILPQRVKQAAPNCRRLFDLFMSGG